MNSKQLSSFDCPDPVKPVDQTTLPNSEGGSSIPHEPAVENPSTDLPPIPEAEANSIGQRTFVRLGQKACISHAPSGHGYEVFLIKYRKARVVKGVSLPASFWYPPNSAWGHWAWSYNSLEKAIRKFHELERGVKKEGAAAKQTPNALNMRTNARQIYEK